MTQTTGNAVVADKAGEKVAEKRRALGRGLESLLPGGPRVVPANTSTLAPNAPKGAVAEGEGEAGRAGAPVAPFSSGERGQGAPATAGEGAGATVAGEIAGATVAGGGSLAGETPALRVDLQAVAARGSEGQPVAEVALSLIDHNPHQTRTFFDEEDLEELAHSIRVQGVIQPIVVRPEGTNGRYILILGERRLRASKLAGKTTIPAIVRRVSEQQAAEMTLVENLQRQDLHCLEQAVAFANLSQEFHLTQDEIGKRVGVSRETVSNYMRLLRLPGPVINYLQRGDLTYSHARELLGLFDEKQVLPVAEKVVKEKMSVVLLEEMVVDLNLPLEKRGEAKRSGARWVDPNVRAAQRNLEMILGMRVRIRDRKGKGKITIEYNTIEDYERVVGMLKGKVGG